MFRSAQHSSVPLRDTHPAPRESPRLLGSAPGAYRHPDDARVLRGAGGCERLARGARGKAARLSDALPLRLLLAAADNRVLLRAARGLGWRRRCASAAARNSGLAWQQAGSRLKAGNRLAEAGSRLAAGWRQAGRARQHRCAPHASASHARVGRAFIRSSPPSPTDISHCSRL